MLNQAGMDLVQHSFVPEANQRLWEAHYQNMTAIASSNFVGFFR